MKKIFLLLFVFISLGSKACLNLFAVDSAGNVRYLEHGFFSEIQFDYANIEARLKNLQKKLTTGNYSYQNISDYGAYLLMSGKFGDGLILFRELIKKHPDIYAICANTAVAFELNGNIDSALYWQNQARALNPYAHGGSEWIHLKILEARKQLQSDPDWCLTNNVTGITELIKQHYREGLHEIKGGGEYFGHFIDQLNERLPFTYAEDKVMGKLLFELGEAYQATSIYRAYYCYALAKYLYPALSVLAGERMLQVRNNYPRGSVKVEGKVVTLGPNKKINDEMQPPDDVEVNQFIRRIINRPSIKNRKFTTLPVSRLILKIK